MKYLRKFKDYSIFESVEESGVETSNNEVRDTIKDIFMGWKDLDGVIYVNDSDVSKVNPGLAKGGYCVSIWKKGMAEATYKIDSSLLEQIEHFIRYAENIGMSVKQCNVLAPSGTKLNIAGAKEKAQKKGVAFTGVNIAELDKLTDVTINSIAFYINK